MVKWKTIHHDYRSPEDFWKAMQHAYKNPATSFADKKILTNNLIAKKINETAWKELGGDEYLGSKDAFYYKLESRLSIIYLKTIRRESVANQVFNNLREFLKVSSEERKTKNELTNQTIDDSQQPILSLSDMSSGSYGAFHNRGDWLQGRRRGKTETIEGHLDYYEYERDGSGKIKFGSDGRPIKKLDSSGKTVRATIPTLRPNISEKYLEERVGVGAILNSLQFLETDLRKDLQEIQRDLMNPFGSGGGGKIYTDPITGRVKFKTWEEIEEEVDPEATEKRGEIKSFYYDKNLSYPENLRNREVVLKEELKITRDQDLIQKRIHAGKCFIETWEKPMELKTREEFEKIKEVVIGFEEFIEEIGNYLGTVRKQRKSGKQILPPQRFYLLLGPPGIGKTYISGMIADYLGKQKIKINCATAFDTELIGREQTYRGADFGNIVKKMIDARDSSPVVVFDEIDKCRDENVLNIISVLFDNTTNVHGFEDSYFAFPVPMNRVLFIATANDEKRLMKVADFVMHRCTRVILKPLTYDQRIELARKEIDKNLKELELDQYISRTTTNQLLKKCLVKETGIRQTLINAKKITDQIDALDTKHGGDKLENAGKNNIPSEINFSDYKWNALIVSDGLDPNCPAKRGGEHVADHKCFIADEVPGWNDNMNN